jgi:hypothetical protein
LRKLPLVIAAGLGVVLVVWLPHAGSARSVAGVPVGAPLRQVPCKVTLIPGPHRGRGAGASIASRARAHRKRRKALCPVILLPSGPLPLRTKLDVRPYVGTIGPAHRIVLRLGGPHHPPGSLLQADLNPELENAALKRGPFRRPPGARGKVIDPANPSAVPGPAVAHAASNTVPGAFSENVDVGAQGINLWETSGAADGNIVFMTGNWDAEFSSNGGATFKEVNPNAMMQGFGGFCCDQIVQYVPQINRFVWLLQGNTGSTNENVDLLALASPAQLLKSGGQSWYYYDWHPEDFGYSGVWMDFPELSVGGQYLIMTTNVVGPGQSVIARLPLDGLKNDTGFSYEYFNDDGSLRPAQDTGHYCPGVNCSTWFARFVNTSTLRVFAWGEGNDVIEVRDDLIATVADSNWSLLLPDGSDVLGPGTKNATIRLQTGTVAGYQVYFAWGEGRDAGNQQIWPLPHIHGVQIDYFTMKVVKEYYVSDDRHGYMIPELATNADDEVAMSFMYGGNGIYANSWVTFLNPTYWAAPVTSGANTGGGHYQSVRPYYPLATCFAAFTYATPSANISANDAHYSVFGRADERCSPLLVGPLQAEANWQLVGPAGGGRIVGTGSFGRASGSHAPVDAIRIVVPSTPRERFRAILTDPAPQCPQQLPHATLSGTRSPDDTLTCDGGRLPLGQPFTVALSTSPPPGQGLGGDLFARQARNFLGPFPITGPGLVANDFSLSVVPPSGQVQAGGSATTSVNTGVTSGSPESIALSAGGLPAGATASFSPGSVTTGGSSTLTIASGGSTPPGTYPVTITGTGATGSHTAPYSLTVTPSVAQSQFASFQCAAPTIAAITCRGTLTSGGAPLGGAPITLTYTPPNSGSPITHALTTSSDETFSDQLSSSSTGPLAPGTWQVEAHYPGDSAHAPANASQSVNVPVG